MNTINRRHSERRLQFLDGLRALGALLVHIGHAVVMVCGVLPTKVGFEVAYDIGKYIAGTLFAVDTFFFISGFLLSYKTLHFYASKKLVGRIQMALQAIWRRWFRLAGLTGFWMLMLLLGSYVVPDGGDDLRGRLITLMKHGAYGGCRRYWLPVLALWANVFDSGKSLECVPWAWHVDTEWQFFLLGVAISVFFANSKKLLSFVCLVLITASTAASLGVSWNLDFGDFDGAFDKTPKWNVFLMDVFHGEHPNYFRHYYVRPECRAAPYVIGFLFGAWIRWHSDEQKVEEQGMNAVQMETQWLRHLDWFTASFAVLSPFTFMVLVHKKFAVVAAILHGLAKVPLSLLLCALFHKALVLGNQWWLWRMCSWEGWVPLSKLSYAWYHAHLPALTTITLLCFPWIRQPGVGVVPAVFLVSIPLTLLIALWTHFWVEKPFIQIGDAACALATRSEAETKKRN